MKRQIMRIDENKCTGCGNCIPNCPEGALQVIDGKARLISDLFCDGLGACIGTCPEGAITTEEREAEPYNEAKVMENIIAAGPNTIAAHLKHLLDHGETALHAEAVAILKERGLEVPSATASAPGCAGNCPGSLSRFFASKTEIVADGAATEATSHAPASALRQWPVQLQLINPNAPYFEGADLLVCADCVPFAYADFHRRLLQGKIVVMFCPKLDKTIDQYVDKLAELFRRRTIRSVTIARMEVPCCGGTERIVEMALAKAGKTEMVRVSIISIQGELQ